MTDVTDNNPQPENDSFGVGALMDRFYDFLDNSSPNLLRTYGIVGVIIVVLFAVVASLNFGEDFNWVRPIAGVPAGIILFLLGLATVHKTSLKTSNVFTWKTRKLPRERAKTVLIGILALAILFVVLSEYIPAGVGGTLMIASILTGYNLVRRTPEEIYLASQGLIDPREQEYEDDETEFDEVTDFEEEGER